MVFIVTFSFIIYPHWSHSEGLLCHIYDKPKRRDVTDEKERIGGQQRSCSPSTDQVFFVIPMTN
ncbi:hypothetical protein KDA_74210 [Dictyobacter alpinus]|uniref:Uncharacterized protein n=1 Tax=Dictyobacter alpinus TaxID=2014873 RepID=A0A402BKP2_9CHLR|nr:hypothetical protein KDA_74210 [Dictyobacter alpinus]